MPVISVRHGNVPHSTYVQPVMDTLSILLVALDILLLFILLEAERTERDEIERRALRSRDGEPTS